jgi:hypothetical protein
MERVLVVKEYSTKAIFAIVVQNNNVLKIHGVTDAGKDWAEWVKAQKPTVRKLEKIVDLLDYSVIVEGPKPMTRAMRSRFNQYLTVPVQPIEEKSAWVAPAARMNRQAEINFKALAFIADLNLMSMHYEVKRTKAFFDSGEWQCSTKTAFGGQLTDRFNRHCGSGMARRFGRSFAEPSGQEKGLARSIGRVSRMGRGGKPLDGDGDGFYAPRPGDPDKTPVPAGAGKPSLRGSQRQAASETSQRARTLSPTRQSREGDSRPLDKPSSTAVKPASKKPKPSKKPPTNVEREEKRRSYESATASLKKEKQGFFDDYKDDFDEGEAELYANELRREAEWVRKAAGVEEDEQLRELMLDRIKIFENLAKQYDDYAEERDMAYVGRMSDTTDRGRDLQIDTAQHEGKEQVSKLSFDILIDPAVIDEAAKEQRRLETEARKKTDVDEDNYPDDDSLIRHYAKLADIHKKYAGELEVLAGQRRRPLDFDQAAKDSRQIKERMNHQFNLNIKNYMTADEAEERVERAEEYLEAYEFMREDADVTGEGDIKAIDEVIAAIKTDISLHQQYIKNRRSGGGKQGSGSAGAHETNFTPKDLDPALGVPEDNMPFGNTSQTIDSQEAASKHIRDGGSMADIPNEFWLETLKANSSQESVDTTTRFRTVPKKGGAVGEVMIFMIRDKDGKAMDQGWVLKGTDVDTPEAANEVAAAALATELGLPVVGGGWDGMDNEYNVYAVLPHGLNGLPDGNAETTPEGGFNNFDLPMLHRFDDRAHPQRLQNFLFNFLISSDDRHGGNGMTFLINGKPHIIPIDHGWSFESVPETPAIYSEDFAMDTKLLEGIPRHLDDLPDEIRKSQATALIKTYDGMLERVEAVLARGKDNWTERMMRGASSERRKNTAFVEAQYDALETQAQRLREQRAEFLQSLLGKSSDLVKGS